MDNTRIYSLLENWVNMDSGSRDKMEVDAFSRAVEAEFRKIGMRTERIHRESVGDLLECRYGDGPRRILLLGHMDTVFPKGTADIQPFRRQKDRFFGPGVLDMKGGIVTILFALENILPILPKEFGIDVLLNSDEEIGSPYSRDRIVEEARKSAMCLSFESAKPGTLTTERKGILNFNLTVRGVSAHSGVNFSKGSSAIEEIAYKVCRLCDLMDSSREITVNVGKIEGGGKVNIVPDFARAECEARYFHTDDRNMILSCLRSIAEECQVKGTNARVEIGTERPPMAMSDGIRRLFGIARSQSLRLGRELQERKTGGGGDISFAASAGIPVLDGLGPEGENSHTDREFVRIESLPYKIELVTHLLEECIGGA